MEREGSGMLAYFTRHPTAATFLMLVMLAVGFVASTKIRSQFFPDVVIDTVTVTVDWDGAGPEELDGAVVSLLEPALQGVEGVASSSAASKEGSSTITLTFEPGWDMARATEETKAAVETIKTLPDSAEEPVVRRGVWKDKVTEVVISGPIAPDQLAGLGDEFLARLYRAGITRTTVTGIAAPQIEVMVPEVARVRNDITLRDVSDAIARQVDTRPAGDFMSSSSRIRAGEDTREAERIRNLALRTDADGSKLYVRNVARVGVTGSDAGRAYYLDDQPAVLIRVDRTAEGDAVKMERTVRSIAEAMRGELPAGVDIRLINARAQDITGQLNILLDNGIAGLILVLITLFLFLSARTAIWVAMGIPVSMLAAIAIMYAAGLTINTMSLFALIITLGIVVDDAIVVAEHADYRFRQMGENASQAPVGAVRRMLGPVFSSTATTILAFFALFFIGGAFGQLISDIPFVVSAVLLASLVESFLILPNHMYHALSAGAGERWYDKPSKWFNRGFDHVADRFFTPLIGWIVRLRYLVVSATILLLAFSVSTVLRGDVPWTFFTAPESGSVSGNFAFLPGATRDDARRMTKELARAVDVVAKKHEGESGIYPVAHALTQVGGTAAKGVPGQETMDQDTLGSIDIGLVSADQRNFSAQEFVRELQQEIKRPAGIAVLSFRSQGLGGAGGDSLAVNFYGDDSFKLKAAADDLITQLGQYPEVTGLQDSLPYGKNDVVLELTPAGEALGYSTDAIGAELFGRLNGITAAEFPAGTRTTAIVVKPPEDELTADFLQSTLMRSSSGEYIPLGELVTVRSAIAFSSINRENGRRLVSVTGALAEDNPERAAEIGAALRNDILPSIASRHNLDWDLGGLALQEDDFLDEAMVGFLLCILGIYLVLGWIFGSWTYPLIVMLVIPFGLIGAIWGHSQFGLAMSLFTVIGLIGMSGIIINDAIVLVTTIQERARSMPVARAAVTGARERLRPIMLTTLTTVLGLAPLMYEQSRQSLFLKPTVVTLVYGLSVGFFVVLSLVPSLLVMRDDIAGALRTTRRLAFSQRAKSRFRWPILAAMATILIGEVALFASFLGHAPANGTTFLASAVGLSLAVALLLAAGLRLFGHSDRVR